MSLLHSFYKNGITIELIKLGSKFLTRERKGSVVIRVLSFTTLESAQQRMTNLK